MATPTFVVVTDRLYERASEMTPEQIYGVVLANSGSVQAAATELGLPEDVVQAAVQFHEAPPTISTGADNDGGGSLELIKDLFGLLAGVAIVVYVLGGAVLFARLYLEELPREAVFGQLPREFLITVGVSQVLVFGLIVAGLYSLARASRFFSGAGASSAAIIVSGAIVWVALVALVAFIASEKRGGPPGLTDATKFWLAIAGSLLLAIITAGVVRRLYSNGGVRWRRGPEWISLAIVYGFVAMVTAASAAATFPLLEAKACTTTGFEEAGALVGHSGDRVFLGELRPDRRRIVALASAEIEELFVGPDAGGPAATHAAQLRRLRRPARRGLPRRPPARGGCSFGSSSALPITRRASNLPASSPMQP